MNDIALANFDKLWALFGNKKSGLLDAKGSMFLVDPIRQFLSLEFANSLTKESAHNIFHLNMAKWGQIEQNEHKREEVGRYKMPDGSIFKKTQFEDSKVTLAREFIISAFYNLCCLASRKKTIEEFIFIANHEPKDFDFNNSNKAFMELIGISNSFLSAEWANKIILRAVSNSDSNFFKKLSKSLNTNISSKTFDTARTWLGTTMLWYLGGKEIKPRREFMLILRKKEILSPQMEETSFNAELYKLHLIK